MWVVYHPDYPSKSIECLETKKEAEECIMDGCEPGTLDDDPADWCIFEMPNIDVTDGEKFISMLPIY